MGVLPAKSLAWGYTLFMDFQCRNLERRNPLFFLKVKSAIFDPKCGFLAQKYDFLHEHIGCLSVFVYVYRCAHLFIDAATSINRWPHLFIDAAASIYRWPHLFIDEGASIYRWRHLFIDAAASIYTWPHLFIDAAASIYRWPHLFIDAAASIYRWPHLFIDGRIYL